VRRTAPGRSATGGLWVSGAHHGQRQRAALDRRLQRARRLRAQLRRARAVEQQLRVHRVQRGARAAVLLPRLTHLISRRAALEARACRGGSLPPPAASRGGQRLQLHALLQTRD
jgi:hypothetical protein